MKKTELPEIEDWGLISYKTAFERQKLYVDEILSGQRRETLVFCHHQPVVTLGRGTREGDIYSWNGEKVEVNRGGRVTYHGPSQLIMYPLVDIGGESPSFMKKKIRQKDIRDYLNFLERALICTLCDYGIRACGGQSIGENLFKGKEGESFPDGENLSKKKVGDFNEGNPGREKTTKNQNRGNPFRGVWVGEKKLASIGIALKKWVTYHGIAVNLFNDEQAFWGIKPCGLSPETMTCLQNVTDQKVKRQTFQKELASHFIFLVYCL